MSTAVNKNQGLLEAALEIENRRRNTLVLVKQAIRSGNLSEADRLITELVPDEKVLGTNPKRVSKLRVVQYDK